MAEKKDGQTHFRPIVLLIIGIVAGLMLMFIGSNEKKASASLSPSLSEEIEMTDKYVKELENRVCSILESMDGISDVKVIITAKECAEIVYAQNSKYNGGSLSEKEYVMADESGMPVKIRIVYPKIKGVAVVCQGGSNPINKERIIELLTSLLDITSSSVCVVS